MSHTTPAHEALRQELLHMKEVGKYILTRRTPSADDERQEPYELQFHDANGQVGMRLYFPENYSMITIEDVAVPEAVLQVAATLQEGQSVALGNDGVIIRSWMSSGKPTP
jgi:hypothetical protein